MLPLCSDPIHYTLCYYNAIMSLSANEGAVNETATEMGQVCLCLSAVDESYECDVTI